MESVLSIRSLGFVQKEIFAWRRYSFFDPLGAGHVRVLFCLDGQASGVSPATVSRSVDISGSLVLSLQSAISAHFRLSLGCDARRGSGCSTADHQFGRLVEP